VAVLTDRRIIKQLMDKRSAVSSDRPVNMVGQQLITEGDHVLLMSNSPTWRMMRKLIHQSLTESLCNSKHTKIQQAEVTQMLHDMMQEPTQWPEHFKRFSNSVIMSIGKSKPSCEWIFNAFHPNSIYLSTEPPGTISTEAHVPLVYGIRSKSAVAPHTVKLSDTVEYWARINEFGATPPVDIFPFLKLVPERFLGNWRTRAKVVHDALHELYEGLLASVLRRREAIGPADCIIDQLLDGQEKSELTTHQIAFLSGVTIKGGSDTSASVLASTMQALVTWPEVQRKAHEEIDAVVGEDRLPTWEDYARLPYIAAMVKESHRWRPVAPLGVPHALSEGQYSSMLRTPQIYAYHP
jgi:cytochrome P450 family 619